MVNAPLTLCAPGIIEQSLTVFLPLSTYDVRSSLVSRQLPRPRRADRSCRLQPLHARRARAMASRGGSILSRFWRRERDAGTRAHFGDQRAGRLRHRLSVAHLGAGRQRATVLRRRADASAEFDSRHVDAAELAGCAIERGPIERASAGAGRRLVTLLTLFTSGRSAAVSAATAIPAAAIAADGASRSAAFA